MLESEIVTRPSSQRRLFTDCTRSALEHDPTYLTQILRGLPYWLERQNRQRESDILGFPGMAVGDVNGDGLEDLFLCECRGVPHCLFIQNPDGTLTNRAATWKVDWIEEARSALLVDLDNDGDQDLVLAAIGALIVASNEGGAFELQATVPCGEDVTDLSAVDYDLDGWVDLYISTYRVPKSGNPPYSIGVHRGAANYLYRNIDGKEAGWAFENVTFSVGLDLDNRERTLQAHWADYDQDGDSDLYQVNEFGDNYLFRNDELPEDGGRIFTNVSDETGIKSSAFGKAAVWTDYNRDSWVDLYQGNTWSAAGQRITTQGDFMPGIAEKSTVTLSGFCQGKPPPTEQRER